MAHLLWLSTGVVAEVDGCHTCCMWHGHGGARGPRICSVGHLWAIICGSTHTSSVHHHHSCSSFICLFRN